MKNGDSEMKKRAIMRVVVCAVAGSVLFVTGCAAHRTSGLAAPDLVSPNVLERESAHDAIIKAGAAAVPVLEEQALSSGRVDLRQAAVIELGKLARQNPEAEARAAEALVRIFLKDDPIVSSTAAAAAMDVGKPALSYLAQAALMLSATPPKAGRQPAWRLPVTLMLAIDRRAAVGAFIVMLGDPAYAAQEGAVVTILGDITEQRFQYNPGGSTQEREATVKKWKEWWEGQTQSKP